MTRQRLYRTPAVILKRMDLGEADRIVTLYSRDEGKVRAVAKGVRRTTSRSAGHLEPFTLSDVLLAVGRELDVVAGGTHGHGQRGAVHPDPERLLAREEVGPGRAATGPAVAGQRDPQHAPPRRPP